MKKKYTLAGIALCVAFLMNYHTVSSKVSQPPAGNDGDPTTFPFAGQTCTQCHSGSVQGSTGKVDITFDDNGIVVPIDSFAYTPATQYTVTFAPTISANRYGFQLSALQSGNTNAGTFLVTNSSNTSLLTGINTKYMGHKNANTTHSWSFKWTAPATDVGNITFYYTFIGANGNNGESGDVVYKGNKVISANQVSGIGNVVEPINNLSVFPNPAVSQFSLTYNADVATNGQAVLYNLYGQVVRQETLPTNIGLVNKNINVAGIAQGVYLLQVTAGDKQSTVKVAIQ